MGINVYLNTNDNNLSIHIDCQVFSTFVSLGYKNVTRKLKESFALFVGYYQLTKTQIREKWGSGSLGKHFGRQALSVQCKNILNQKTCTIQSKKKFDVLTL